MSINHLDIMSCKDFVNYADEALKQCQTLVDMYMIDYFVQDLWHKLLPSWQIFYEAQLNAIGSDKKAIIQLVKHILRRPGEPSIIKLSSPEPLSIIALKKVVANIELKQWKVLESPQEILPKLGLDSEPLTSFTNLRTSLPPALRLKIKVKKEHEISRIADIAKLLIKYLGPIDEILDVGSGIGHLSRILSLLLDKKVSTIEGDPALVETANKLDEKISKNLKFLTKKRKIEGTGKMNTPDRKAVYVKEEEQIGNSEGRKMVAGLHTCGDFSATIIKYFCANDDAQILLHFGCCYHKLNGGKDKPSLDIYDNVDYALNAKGYPLSQAFSMLKLSYAARDVACFGHEQFIAKLDESLTKKAFFVNCYRAILEWIIYDCPTSNDNLCIDESFKYQGLRGIRNAEALDFWQYAEEALRDKPHMKNRFYQIVEKRPNLRDDVPKMSAAESAKNLLIYTFRILVAPIVEAVILRDREYFLKEQGLSNTFLIPLFNPVLSPRNMALISWKSRKE